MWAAISAAANAGWGPTLRIVSILAAKGFPWIAALVIVAHTPPVSSLLKLLTLFPH